MGIGGGGFDGGGGGDAEDGGRVEEDGLEFEALVAGEVGGEVAVLPARAVVDHEGVEFVFFDGDAEGLAVVLGVYFAVHFGDVDFVFITTGRVRRGVGEVDALGFLVGADLDGLGVEEGAVAAELDVGGLAGEAIKAQEGGGVEGVAFVDPVGGINLVDGGVGGDFVGADEEAVEYDATGGDQTGGFGGVGGEVVAAVADDDDGGG